MVYYAILNDVQVGPVDPGSLMRMSGFDADTLVWADGMSDWIRAGDVNELADLLSSRPVPPPINGGAASAPGSGQNYPPYDGGAPLGGYINQPYYPPYSQQYYSGPQSGIYPDPAQRPFNWVGWSIFNLVIGLGSGIIWVLGLIGLIFAIKANESYTNATISVPAPQLKPPGFST